MRTAILAAAAVLALAGCGDKAKDGPDISPGAADMALIIAFDTAFETLNAFVAAGDLDEQPMAFMDATVNYAGGGCKILTDPATTPEQKRLALMVDLADERAAFDAELAKLTGINGLDPRLVPAVKGAQSVARLFATYRANPEFWERPCGTVSVLETTWEARRPMVLA